jgi:hypothetical protein
MTDAGRYSVQHARHAAPRLDRELSITPSVSFAPHEPEGTTPHPGAANVDAREDLGRSSQKAPPRTAICLNKA